MDKQERTEFLNVLKRIATAIENLQHEEKHPVKKVLGRTTPDFNVRRKKKDA